MVEVFSDTSGWAALFVGKEPSHTQADALAREWRDDGTRVVTTNYVVAELVALLTSPLRVSRERQVAYIEAIYSATWVEVVHIDSSHHQAAWALFKMRLDKSWSLVDCSSFVLMQRRGIADALTSDHHFEQAGFNSLLKGNHRGSSKPHSTPS